MINLFNYIDRPSPIHALTGASKLVCLLAWSVAAMTSFNTPLLVFMTVAAFVLFRMAKLKIRDISVVLALIVCSVICVVMTGETALYANIIIKKGVVV